MNLLVSACLLGVHCRYDGKCQNISQFQERIPELMERYHLIPVCPELFGGLCTPRKPAEIRDGQVVTEDGENVTDAFQKGAEEVLALAELYQCDTAILKQRSPSCGSSQIYDGTFSKKLIDGRGMTAKLLESKGIQVLSEEDVISNGHNLFHLK